MLTNRYLDIQLYVVWSAKNSISSEMESSVCGKFVSLAIDVSSHICIEFVTFG